ncbi:MAG: DUF1302 family protein [Gammaproteobacteria bacterium]
MTKHNPGRLLLAASAGSLLFSGGAAAIDWNVTGFVRQEIAYSISTQDNYNNQMTSPFADRITPHLTHPNTNPANATAPTSVYVNPNGVVGGLFSAPGGPANPTGNALLAGANTSSPVDCRFALENALAAGSAGLLGGGKLNGQVAFPGQLCPNGAGSAFVPGVNPAAGQGFSPQGAALEDDINFNVFNTRVEVDVQARISQEFKAYMKIRGYFDGTRNFTDGEIGDHFANPMWGNRRGTITEWNSPDSIIDIPALYLDWHRGPLWLRLGNQTIAWGEAYFFRVMDVANGLDLRRHLVLGPGAEEYQDQRIASPGIRLSYSFNNGWELDAFAQLFSPSLLPGQNTPYSLIPHSVAVNDEIGMDDAKGAWNFGFRMTMPFTESFTGMVGYVNRRNPDGVFSGVDAQPFWRGRANPFCLGRNNDTNNILTQLGLQGAVGGAIPAMPTLDTRARTMANGCGTSFMPDPYTAGAVEYWENIRRGRLDEANYLIGQINEFPGSQWATREIFGFGEENNFVDSMRTLEGFRSSFGSVAQWVGRQFKRENIFIVGGNYIVTTDDMNSIFDQLIIRGEVSVTPNKRLTNDLSFNFTHKDDVVSALILEKYHRISNEFPATYMVAQWMHRTATDMFGRDLDKNGTAKLGEFIDSTTGAFKPAAFNAAAKRPEGNSSANYVVFAFQQPFPNLIWRFDMSILVDTAGGYLLQPGVRYRPGAKWQWDLYANIVDAPGGQQDTIMETIDFADEIFARLTYFF